MNSETINNQTVHTLNMDKLNIEEIPAIPLNRLRMPDSAEQRKKRIKIAVLIIGPLAVLLFFIQFLGMLNDQKADTAAMGDRVQKLEQENNTLKNQVAGQSDSIKSISSNLSSTQTRLESTRQDLGEVKKDLLDTQSQLASEQKDIFDQMKSEADYQKMQFEEFKKEMSSWKQGYAAVLADFNKRDESYKSDITVILQKIQSLDIGNINDKIYSLQMTIMNLEKKLLGPAQTPFNESPENIRLISPDKN